KHRELDTMVPVEAMPLAARMYADGHDLRMPTISPLYGDFRGLPPLLLHVSSSEVLYDDALRVAQAARDAGVTAELRVWPLLPHAFPAFVGILPGGPAAVAEIARFVERVVPWARTSRCPRPKGCGCGSRSASSVTVCARCGSCGRRARASRSSSAC